ncbi:hypothetical protein EJB05_06188 [Eragrostis curvula]|uniref:Uncharacterized protein n=1 Tax=Eragrostis curvula TaxID=38414 RepID=A0A5J9WF23_9POAL|nr:hypothetical protein EJB05_06188 [Eragrostis curvula]
MPAAARLNLDSITPRRSARLKNIHVLYDEDSDRDSLTLKRVKVEVTDPEEILSPSTSAVTLPSVNDKDDEHAFHNISLKDLRARCKTKNRKASKGTSEGTDLGNQTESLNIEDEKAKEELDLDKPLIALKQKRQRTSPSKANKEMDLLPLSQCDVKVEDTSSERNQTPGEISPLEAVMDDSVVNKLDRRPTDLVHSTIAVDCTKEIVPEENCCAEGKDPVEPLVNCENADILDINSEEVGTTCCVTPSCSERNSNGYSSVELQQVSREDEQCEPQPCLVNQLTKSAHVSDHSCELISSTEACNFDESNKHCFFIGLIDEASNHQETPEDITNSDTNKYSTKNGFLVCSVNQSCNDYIYDDEYWNTGVVERNEAETVNMSEELSPVDESNMDIMSPLVSIRSDLCGSVDMKCTSLEEVVQMQADSQLDTIVGCDLRPKQILEDTEIQHATADYTFVFYKTHDLVPPANFVTQDGRLESIVYDALHNHTQKTSENRSCVGLPDTDAVRSPDFTDSCPGDAISAPNYGDWSMKNMDKLNSTTDYGLCKSVSNERSCEVQAQFLEASVPSDISIAEEAQEMPAQAPNSSATSLETENQIVKSDIFIDEESTEEHAPKKLFSKRKIMSPSSQEKLCNALTGIDLCGVEQLKSNLNQPALSRERSGFNTDRRLRGRTSVLPTSKGVLKSGETPSHQQTTCSCKRNSPVVLDTEKAVEFSQRQMQDIENIAAKLIRSLNHMKSIVDETLSSEAYSIVPNFNPAEIRAASEDASEVERTTRKWLAIMNKDCNRFCKILTLAKKNNVSHDEAPRKQRKIMFADEAGGKLCHVKVFKDKHASLSECQSD